MSERNNGGPAFPIPLLEGETFHGNANGMSMRDWFAGMTLQGFMANTSMLDYLDRQSDQTREHRIACVAILCYEYADAMLQERARSE